MNAYKWYKNLEPEGDMAVLLDITRYFLTRYFGHSDSMASSLVDSYFKTAEDFEDDDKYNLSDYIAENMSWNMALQIHYRIVLGGSSADVMTWARDNGWLISPVEAKNYMKDNFWYRKR